MIALVRTLICGCALSLAMGPLAVLADQAEPKEKAVVVPPKEAAQQLVDKAYQTVVELKEKPRFTKLLTDAKGVLIVPELLKAGFILGGKGGSGVLLVHQKDGSWSYPAFYRVAAGSIGFQFGVEVAEMGFVIMSDAALDRVLDGNIELGAGIGITLATVGGSVEVGTEVDIYTFSISKGAFAGVSFEGASLTSNEERNEAYYGRAVTALEIAKEGGVENPAAEPLQAVLDNK